jgi:hypothetical protein
VNEALIPPLLQAESAAWYLFSFVYGSSYIMFLFLLFLGHIINSNITCLHKDKRKSCQQEQPDIKEKKKVVIERTWTSKEKSII